MKYIIFGATSAIAESVARALVARGDHLFLVARDSVRLQAIVDDLQVRIAGSSARIASATADLSDQSRHEALFDAGEAAIGQIDAILVAHGTLPDQSICEASIAETMRAIDINALSAISIATVAANRFEPRRHGTIAVISSVAGDRGRGSNYVYGAAKGMVSIFLQGLRNRLAKAGVAVVTIKPGFVDTPMTAHIDRKGALWATPAKIAPAIVRAMDRGKSEVYVPGFWWLIMLIIRHIPEIVFKRLSL